MPSARSFALAVLASALLAGCGGNNDHSGNPVAPRITAAPESATVDLGAPATFSVAATGDDLAYQWLKDGVAIDGANAASYTVAAATVAAQGAYSVQVTGAHGTTTSDPAFLVLVGAPQITAAPTGIQVTSGKPATFAVVATGDAPLAYQWSKDGTAIDGATGPTYIVAAGTPATAGEYAVVVSNPKGQASSGGAALTVVVPTPPSIAGQPTSLTVGQGKPATFRVVANGTDLAYQWFRGTTAIPGAAGPTLTVDPAAAGTYHVVVSNALASVTSADATLAVVVPPSITTGPASQTVNAGAAVTFSVVAAGDALKYQWLRDGVPVAGATAASYTLAAATASDAKPYSVVVSNAAGKVASAAATLTVRVPPSVTNGPTIVVNGGSTAVTVTGAGTAPLAYQWYRNDVAVDGATDATYTIGTVTPAKAGVYYVVVSNAAGSVTSRKVTIVG